MWRTFYGIRIKLHRHKRELFSYILFKIISYESKRWTVKVDVFILQVIPYFVLTNGQEVFLKFHESFFRSDLFIRLKSSSYILIGLVHKKSSLMICTSQIIVI